jgi:hypothetical protein
MNMRNDNWIADTEAQVVAKRMISDGFPLEKVARLSGLRIEEVNVLAERLGIPLSQSDSVRNFSLVRNLR